jgi:hypothetical protein
MKRMTWCIKAAEQKGGNAFVMQKTRKRAAQRSVAGSVVAQASKRSKQIVTCKFAHQISR